jgi:hypothetical protein
VQVETRKELRWAIDGQRKNPLAAWAAGVDTNASVLAFLDSIHIYMVMLPNKFAFVVLAMD